MYDVIGDIHGHYAELHALLLKMGYVYDEAAHNFVHPTRKALFIGDFIDGGRENLKVVALARNMVESGNAVAIMGNHEFNAVLYATPDPNRPGEFLRAHDEKNNRQHGKFLREVSGDPEAYRAAIEWFKTLPVYFKQGDLHAVHACWHEAAIEVLKKDGAIAQDGRVTPSGWLSGAEKHSPGYAHFEVLLKGPEEELGDGRSFRDAHGAVRTAWRLKWWVENPATYNDAFNFPPGAAFAFETYQPASASAPSAQIRAGLKDVGMLLFGHYWMSGEPDIFSSRVACVDYSVARKGGRLAAYRVQADEAALNAKNFVSVPALG